MFIVNNREIVVNKFPDNTQNIKHNFSVEDENLIYWCYDSDSELFTLLCLVDYIRSKNGGSTIDLILPYIPNARMDRVNDYNDVFTLKSFANIINSMKFNTVKVVNPHSNVSMALINNIEEMDIDKDIANVFYKMGVSFEENKTLSYKNGQFLDKIGYSVLNVEDFVLFFPDEGACKRYTNLKILKDNNFNIAFGIKKRDWQTGEIKSLDVFGDVDGKTVLIIDDICSAGGTFYHSAIKLKEMGAKSVSLYVTHCENTIVNGKLLNGDSPIDNIYTTDTILTDNSVIENEKVCLITRYR